MNLFTSIVRSTSLKGSTATAVVRCMSNVPENAVYGGPKPQSPDKRVTLTYLRQKHSRGEPITMVTAYDYPSAVHLDTAGIDVCLIGDSAAMVVHGHDTTLPITLDEMLVHCRSVARGAQRPLLVADLPFGSYESSTQQFQLLLGLMGQCRRKKNSIVFLGEMWFPGILPASQLQLLILSPTMP